MITITPTQPGSVTINPVSRSVSIVAQSPAQISITRTGSQGVPGPAVLDGDKGDVSVVNGQWLLDDIDLGTFN